jgi:histidinol dehydrogenase
MNIIRYSDKNFSDEICEAAAISSLFDEEIENRTREILREVFIRGDDALLEFTERFDGARLSADQLPVTQAELLTASLKADEALREAVAEAEKNIAMFAKKSLRHNWQCKNSHRWPRRR